MEFSEAVARRRMVRSFTPDPVDPALLDRLLDQARRAPSAGHSQGTAFVALDSVDAVAGYWDVTFPAERRPGFRWPGLFTAPVLVVCLCSPSAYVERYAEPDKAATGLGRGAGNWSTPYWYVDGGMVVQNLLLGVVDAGLAACFFGLFEHEGAVLASLGVPDGWRALGTVAIGHPARSLPGRPFGGPAPAVARRGRPSRRLVARSGPAGSSGCQHAERT